MKKEVLVRSAQFVKSTQDIGDLPEPHLPEYAFVGRSNVGKSSLINMLTDRKKLAKTSTTPGKTRLINHFIINSEWYLVDLPGYGYARVSKEARSRWNKLLTNYLLKRENLLCVFALIDSRLPPQANDLEFIHFLGTHQVPFVIVFTKSDKTGKPELTKRLKEYEQCLLQTWEILPRFLFSSSVTRSGKQDILSFIQETNTWYNKNN